MSDETPPETAEPEAADAPEPAAAEAPAEPPEQPRTEAEHVTDDLGTAPAPETQPVAEAIEEAQEAAAPAEGEAAAPAEGAAAAPAEGAATAPAEGEPKKKRPRRRKGGSKVAEQWGVSKTKAAGLATQKVDLTSPAPRPPLSRGGRSREPLPFDELRAAAQAITDMEGARKALRDAFGELAPKERNDISQLVSEDGDFRQRARKISAGSLAARKLGKALAAQQVAIAHIEDVWAVTLSKEEAAQRLSRVRAAKNRDAQRAKRNEERNRRSDRVSREDLEKAQDGRVGAQVRFVIQGEEKRDRKKKDEKAAKPTTANDLLDRLGY